MGNDQIMNLMKRIRDKKQREEQERKNRLPKDEIVEQQVEEIESEKVDEEDEEEFDDGGDDDGESEVIEPVSKPVQKPVQNPVSNISETEKKPVRTPEIERKIPEKPQISQKSGDLTPEQIQELEVREIELLRDSGLLGREILLQLTELNKNVRRFVDFMVD